MPTPARPSVVQAYHGRARPALRQSRRLPPCTVLPNVADGENDLHGSRGSPQPTSVAGLPLLGASARGLCSRSPSATLSSRSLKVGGERAGGRWPPLPTRCSAARASSDRTPFRPRGSGPVIAVPTTGLLEQNASVKDASQAQPNSSRRDPIPNPKTRASSFLSRRSKPERIHRSRVAETRTVSCGAQKMGECVEASRVANGHTSPSLTRWQK